MKVLFGCILFEGQGVEKTNIIEVFDVVECTSIEDSCDKGEEYLNNGGDSYLVLTPEVIENVIWHEDALVAYNKLININ